MLILIKSSFEGQSQTPNDTICLPVVSVKKVYADAKAFRLTDSLLRISEAQLSEVKYQKGLIEDREAETINNYNRQIENLEKQISVYKDQMIVFNKAIRREKRKRFFATAGGVLSTGIMIYLSTKK